MNVRTAAKFLNLKLKKTKNNFIKIKVGSEIPTFIFMLLTQLLFCAIMYLVVKMKNHDYMLSYIETYGNLDFNEKPFNEIDNIIFSQLAYLDFEGILDKRKKLFLCDAAMKYFALHSDEEIDNLLSIHIKASKLLMACAKTRRYGWIELCCYVNNINDDIDKQLSAICFVLQDDNILIAFRGTDTTVTGVKESAMLSYMFPVPAQIEALHYFQETAMLHKGKIRVCGHSKGGNLAVFAAVNCSNSLKKRLVGVYENDAPGFPKWFFDRYDYRQIKDIIHLYTPQTSIIGRILYHDAKPIIVKSDNNGLKQHQVSSWIIHEDTFEIVDEYDITSDFAADYINTLIDYVGDDDLELFLNTLDYVLTNMGIEDFYDVKELDLKKVFALVDSLTNLDDVHKERFKMIIKKAFSDFAKEYLSVKAKGYKDKYSFLFQKREKNEKQSTD